MKANKQARREAKQLFRLCHKDGTLDEDLTQRLLQRVIHGKPRSYLAVLTHFQRLLEFEYAQHAARIESATPLPPDLRASVQARLARVYGPRLNISITVTPALIGGLRITVGSDVYDNSVRARLTALEERF